MATVEAWFIRWAARHMERFPRDDWPDGGSEFWPSLYRRFTKSGVREADADAASEALMESPPGFPDRHPEAILAKVREIWRAASLPSGSGPDAAKAESRGCPYCSGQGLATVYRPTPRESCSRCGELLPADHLACPFCEPRARRVPPTTAAHCVCPYGRWLRAALAKDADTLARIPDLANVLDGRSVWLAESPRADPSAWVGSTQALRDLLDAHRHDRGQAPRREPEPMGEAERAFYAKLDPARAARFAGLDPAARRRVMAAVGDPLLRAEAVGLIGPAPAREV